MTTPLHPPDDYVLSIGDLSHRVGLSPYTIRDRTSLPPEDPRYLDHLRVPAGRRFTLALAEQLKADLAAQAAAS